MNIQKGILAASAIYLLDLFLSSKGSNKIGSYAVTPEKIVSSALPGVGAFNIDVTDKPLTAAERKAMLKDAGKFTKSNIRLHFSSKVDILTNRQIRSSNDSYHIFKDIYPEDKLDQQEMVVVLYLNQENRVVAHDLIHMGGVNLSVVDAKLIIQKAILSLATGVIVSHNHPSGSLRPSSADVAITQKLTKAMKLIDISLLDHLIVSNRGYYSFADEGMM